MLKTYVFFVIIHLFCVCNDSSCTLTCSKIFIPIFYCFYFLSEKGIYAERISLMFSLLIGIFKNVLPSENSFSTRWRRQHLGTFSTCMASPPLPCMSDCTELPLWYLRKCPVWLPRSPLHLLFDSTSLRSLPDT